MIRKTHIGTRKPRKTAKHKTVWLQKNPWEIDHMSENIMYQAFVHFSTRLRDTTRSTTVAHISVDSELAPT